MIFDPCQAFFKENEKFIEKLNIFFKNLNVLQNYSVLGIFGEMERET
jgi:hypothetical protein